jgi:hypothetical protein
LTTDRSCKRTYFLIPKNATTEEFEAVIERGMDATIDAADTSINPDISFFFA